MLNIINENIKLLYDRQYQKYFVIDNKSILYTSNCWSECINYIMEVLLNE